MRDDAVAEQSTSPDAPGSKPPIAATVSAGATPLPDARMSLGAAVLADLFPEGPAFRRSLRTYVVLLTLASFIASFGLYQNSVASIIGAMVVAPLGGAIMAVAGALVTGRLRWQPIALAQSILGAAWVAVIGYFVAILLPTPLILPEQIAARTHPGLLDLGVALAAGAAGAYVTVRRTGTDALPGVAIAVSLVPPLATVGICLQLGRIADAGGALVLFTTNFAAIIVAATVVFVIAGAAPTRDMLRERSRLRVGATASVVLLAVVAIPLVERAAAVVQTVTVERTAAPIVQAWVTQRNLKVSGYTVNGTAIDLLVTGPDRPTDVRSLANAVAAALGQSVQLEMEWIQSATEDVTGSP